MVNSLLRGHDICKAGMARRKFDYCVWFGGKVLQPVFPSHSKCIIDPDRQCSFQSVSACCRCYLWHIVIVASYAYQLGAFYLLETYLPLASLWGALDNPETEFVNESVLGLAHGKGAWKHEATSEGPSKCKRHAVFDVHMKPLQTIRYTIHISFLCAPT